MLSGKAAIALNLLPEASFQVILAAVEFAHHALK